MNVSVESRVAVLEVEQRNMRDGWTAISRQIVEHERKDDDRFERQFLYMRGMKDEILETIGGVEDKVSEKIADLEKKLNEKFSEKLVRTDTLWDERNQRTGALRFSSLVSHGVTMLLSIGGALGILRVFK